MPASGQRGVQPDASHKGIDCSIHIAKHDVTLTTLLKQAAAAWMHALQPLQRGECFGDAIQAPEVEGLQIQRVTLFGKLARQRGSRALGRSACRATGNSW